MSRDGLMLTLTEQPPQKLFLTEASTSGALGENGLLLHGAGSVNKVCMTNKWVLHLNVVVPWCLIGA